MTRPLACLLRILPILVLTVGMAGCDLVGDIIQFGFWMLVILVAIIVAIIWWIARRLGGRRSGPPPPPSAP